MEVCLRTLALSLLAACGVVLDNPGTPPAGGGSDGKGDGSAPSGQQSASQFLRRIGMVQCDHAFTCRASFPGSDTAFIRKFGASAGECYAGAEVFYAPDLVESQIRAGKIAYDATAAAQCVAGTTLGADCAAYWKSGTQFDPVCNAALVGKVADGDDCETVFDCAGANTSCDLDINVCVPG